MFRVRYTQTADDCFTPLSPEQTRAIIRIVANIQVNPYADDWVKTQCWEMGAMYTIYQDNRGNWVVYHIVDNDLIEVVGLGVNAPYVPLETD